ncbi:MAG: tetratricopeptide repeat protein [Nitrospirales bacterium]|nr:tetratricopeptide repeat protein [Nitrospira sp.]MDR4500925.1 tetratricopeptide repeat protein [Nitrospirales bacterium]
MKSLVVFALKSESKYKMCVRRVLAILAICLLLLVSVNSQIFAHNSHRQGAENIAIQAEDAWLDGANVQALEMLDQGIQAHPDALRLQRLKGDVLATSRRISEAIEAYDSALRADPKALDVHWAKWSVLLRAGRSEEAISELERIADIDAKNPLVPLQIAVELRKLDRLEESFRWYEKAVALKPEMPGWRLAMARARFDILDGRGARDEVKKVLTMVVPGSPEDMAARSLLSVVYGATKERGRRYQPIFSPEGTAAERKEWAAIRAKAWGLFEAGQYAEAEPVLRKVLTLKPSDHAATHDLGVTLMELDRYEEALPVLEKVLTITTNEEVLADTFFQIGQTLTALERWSEAYDHFEILYQAAVEFEETNKDVGVMPGVRVLSKEKLVEWMEKVRPHVPDATKPAQDKANAQIPPADPASPEAQSADQVYEQVLEKTLKPEDPMYRRASLMGRDADFSTFRFVISADRVMRDDLPSGAHDFIPIEPNNTFSSTQEEVILVFGLVTPSFHDVQLTAECFMETPKILRGQKAVAQDKVVMAMNEQSGYFVLSKPEQAEWTPGLYRCGLFIGEEISAYTHADEVRFRIVEPVRSS